MNRLNFVDYPANIGSHAYTEKQSPEYSDRKIDSELQQNSVF